MVDKRACVCVHQTNTVIVMTLRNIILVIVHQHFRDVGSMIPTPPPCAYASILLFYCVIEEYKSEIFSETFGADFTKSVYFATVVTLTHCELCPRIFLRLRKLSNSKDTLDTVTRYCYTVNPLAAQSSIPRRRRLKSAAPRRAEDLIKIMWTMGDYQQSPTVSGRVSYFITRVARILLLLNCFPVRLCATIWLFVRAANV